MPSVLDLSGPTLNLRARRGASVRVALTVSGIDLTGYVARARAWAPEGYENLDASIDGSVVTVFVPGELTEEIPEKGGWRWAAWVYHPSSHDRIPVAVGQLTVAGDSIL